MSTKLSKYADKIRTIAKESSLDENAPDKYLLAIADAVENNKFQLSSVIESHINTRKELCDFRKAATGDILSIHDKINSLIEQFDEHKKAVEQNINATTLFHQNMTDLLIAYFGIPKKADEEATSEDVEEQEIEDKLVQEEPEEVPEIVSDEEIIPEDKKEVQLEAEITSDEIISERQRKDAGVKEFKPKGKKNDKQ